MAQDSEMHHNSSNIHLAHVHIEKNLKNRKEGTFCSLTQYHKNLNAQMYTDISLCQLTSLDHSAK